MKSIDKFYFGVGMVTLISVCFFQRIAVVELFPNNDNFTGSGLLLATYSNLKLINYEVISRIGKDWSGLRFVWPYVLVLASITSAITYYLTPRLLNQKLKEKEDKIVELEQRLLGESVENIKNSKLVAAAAEWTLEYKAKLRELVQRETVVAESEKAIRDLKHNYAEALKQVDGLKKGKQMKRI